MDRDIVQFVAMRDFQTESAHHELPRAVLEEIPDQFMGYMHKHNIQPNDRIKRRTLDLEVNPRFVGDPDEPPPAYTSSENHQKAVKEKGERILEATV